MAPTRTILLSLLILCIILTPVAAFGPGDVAANAAIDGYNWRHGDLANVLLTLPRSLLGERLAFSEDDVKLIYFANWCRDYSQLIDVKSLSLLPADILNLVVAVLGLKKFGYATEEYAITRDRLGCYRPEEHIDNPKGYSGRDDPEQSDATRGQMHAAGLREVWKHEELSIDPNSGMKNYIANEGLAKFASSSHTSDGIGTMPDNNLTAADYLRNQIRLSIEEGRNGNRPQAFFHLGSALHTLEDFSAHSNFTELCLRQLQGPYPENIFPLVGDGCRMQSPSGGLVPPLVTGTFGNLDLIQTIIGEMDDSVAESQGGQGTFDELDKMLKVPSGPFKAAVDVFKKVLEPLSKLSPDAAKLLNTLSVSVNNSAEDQGHEGNTDRGTNNDETARRIAEKLNPLFQLNDDFNRFIDQYDLKILSESVQRLKDWFSIVLDNLLAVTMAPILLPVREALKITMDTLEAQERKYSPGEDLFAENSMASDPSHSMLSKDHYANILNRPAGLIASVTTNWTVQQVVQCWDDPNINIDTTLHEIVKILHHPSFVTEPSFIQQVMFDVVKAWWEEMIPEHDDLLARLGKAGVQDSKNIIPVDDSVYVGKARGPAVFRGSAPACMKPPPREKKQIPGPPGKILEVLKQAQEMVVKGVESMKESLNKEYYMGDGWTPGS